jgi:hypothetical protein
MDTSKKGLLPCRVFAVSSYPGHMLTFQVLVEDKFIFSYIPVHALTNDYVAKELPDKQATYFNSPSCDLTVHIFNDLLNKRCVVFDRAGNQIDSGAGYCMTFDWHNDNQLCHLVIVNDNYMLWPSHKLIFLDDKIKDEDIKLPAFKKLHQEWRL